MYSTISIHENPARPKIGITMGDPAGIGPEICIKALNNSELTTNCEPIVFGDSSVLSATAAECGLSIKLNIISAFEFFDAHQRPTDNKGVIVVDFKNSVKRFRKAAVSAESGDAAFKYIDKAIRSHDLGLVDAVVTGPINKLSMHAAGHKYPGHTELFAEKTSSTNFCMLQYSPVVSCSFVTTHCGYAEVIDLLSVDRIVRVIQLTNDAFLKIEQREPKLIVCGLNPHAGEDGLFGGREEERIIAPAISKAQDLGINVVGPYPPDTCFIEPRREEFDCVVCMYHDQGHIPLKALAFEQAVNTTLGLPMIRTSVDHGTAFDIVGKNQADPSSLIAAIQLATKLAQDSSTRIGKPKIMTAKNTKTANQSGG